MFCTTETFLPITYEAALEMCYRDSNFLENVPNNIIDYKLCLILAKYHGFVLADTPPHFRDYNLCLMAPDSDDVRPALNSPKCYWELLINKDLQLLINTL